MENNNKNEYAEFQLISLQHLTNDFSDILHFEQTFWQENELSKTFKLWISCTQKICLKMIFVLISDIYKHNKKRKIE